MAHDPRTIVIVGGGFSGIVLAANLLRRPPQQQALRIVLLERCAQLGGAAYATREYPFLLNVAAGRMSADSRAPDAFLEFARRREPATGAQDFLPRAWYGEYLRDMLEEARRAAPSRVRFEHLTTEAMGITRTPGGGLRVECADGRVLAADQLVLACGNPQPAQLPGLDLLASHPRYVRDVCGEGPPGPLRGEVLLVGTGLTMADAALAAAAQGTRVVRAISRHGLVPPAQSAAPHWRGTDTTLTTLAGVRSVRGLLQVARALAREAGAAGADWRDIINGIRERAPGIWHGLDEAERRRFLRHLRPYWDVHRHRLPPSTAARLRELRQAGRLHVHAGRIVEARPEGERLRVVWRPRGQGTLQHLRVDWMLNCTGPDYDLRRTAEPLFRSAIRMGLAVPDACGLGLRTGEHGALLDAAGCVSDDVFCLGPLLRADHWETTAVAELRAHAEALATRLAGMQRGSGVAAACRGMQRNLVRKVRGGAILATRETGARESR